MIIINESDIYESTSFSEVMDAIEESYKLYHHDRYNMPDRIHIGDYDKTLLYMPCFTEKVFGTKFLTVFSENRKLKLPTIDGLMILNDYDTGKTLSIIDGKSLTSLRTGAVGGVGIRYTTPENVKSLGLVGAGAQGFTQLLFACNARDFEKIYVYDIFSDIVPGFIKKIKKIFPDIDIIQSDNTTDLLKSSDVIITTTTSNEPLFPDDENLFKGKHFIGIGSYKPNMREYPDALIKTLDKVYIDTNFAKEETGDLIDPISSGILSENRIELFSEYIINEKNKENIIQNTTFFKSVGMALFDLVAANLVYKNCLEKNIGQKVNL